jgi:hypothetical protein
MSDSYLLEAGWAFFAAWGVVVLIVSWAAFGRDLLPKRSQVSSPVRPAAFRGKDVASSR